MSAENSASLPANQPANDKPLIKKSYVIIGVVVALVLAGLFIWGVVYAAQNLPTQIETARDIFIIALALESCVFGVVILLLLIMVIRLVNMVEFEIKPILEKTNETLGTVRGATAFMSQNVVQPVTRASSYLAGFRRGMQAFFGDPKKNLRD